MYEERFGSVSSQPDDPRLIYSPLRGVRSPLAAVCNYMLALWSRLNKHLHRIRQAEANCSLKRV
jgi:hypothetical protein